MPIFDSFDGIVISVFMKEHLPPHCHARYAEHEALIDICTVEIIAGHLPSRVFKKAKTYIQRKENQQDLLEAFYLLNPHIKRK